MNEQKNNAALRKSPWAVVSSLALTAIVFLIDILSPIGATISFAYVPVVALAIFSGGLRFVTGLSLVCSVLTWVAVGVSLDGVPIWVAITNRLLCVLVIWAIVVMGTIYHRSRRQLAEQREWLATTLASIGDAVIASNLDGRVAFLNPVAEQLTGWLSAEAVGKRVGDVFKIVNEDTRQPMEDPISRVLRAGGSAVLANHTMLVSRDGHELPIDDSGAPIRDAAGNLVGVVMVFRDISSRRAAEASLRASEDEYRATFELAAVGKAQVDVDTGRFVRVNQRLCDITGYSREELLGLTYLEITHPDDRGTNQQFFRQLVSAEIPEYSLEKRYLKKEGQPVWVQATAVVTRDAHGRAHRAIAVIEEITGRKQAEEQAEAHLAEIEALLDAVPAAVWIAHDPQCQRITGNRASYELLEMTPIENASLSAPPDEKPTHFRVSRDGQEVPAEQLPVQMAAAGREVRGAELELLFADGKVKYEYGHAIPLFDSQGKPRGAVAAFLDVTELKRAQHRLRIRTRELARSNAELEEFAYVASHDLRSPLLSLNGCVQLLAEQYAGKLDEDADELIRYIRQSVDHLADLIRGLLEYSRVGSGGMEPADCDCNRIVAAVLENLTERIEASHAEIIVDDLPAVQADTKQLTQLFQHLIDNAIKYHETQAPRVTITSETNDAEWVFRITDRGIGIDPQHFSKLFQIFQRLHKDESRYSGSGVGLAICKKIVSRHGGRIWIESVPREGSSFVFALPRVSAPQLNG